MSHVTFQFEGKMRRIALPFFMGTHERCVLVLTDPQLPPMEWKVDLEGQKLTLKDVYTGFELPLQNLEKVGLKNLKYSNSTGRLGPARRKEKLLAHSIGAVLALMSFFGAGMVSAEVSRDASKEVIPLALDENDPTFYGYEGEEISYEKGISRGVVLDESQARLPTRLTWVARGVEGNQNFRLRLGGAQGQILFESSVPGNCRNKGCRFEKEFPGNFFSKGRNVLYFENVALNPLFLVANVRFGTFPNASESDIESIQDGLASAEEFLGGELVSKGNLVRARLAIENAFQLTLRKKFPVEWTGKVSKTRANVLSAMRLAADNGLLEAEQALRVGDRKKAKEKWEEISKLFPDDTTEEGKRIKKLRDVLKGEGDE
jgi:hypothetical protein